MIDTLVIPFPRNGNDIRQYMREPWRTRPFPVPHRYLFPAPTGQPPYGEWQASARGGGVTDQDVGALKRTNLVYLARDAAALPASDPQVVIEHLDAIGAEQAILMPLTRGIAPDVDMGSVICAATNDWLADTWLGEREGEDGGRFLGTIRVNPRDPVAAAREVQRWAGDGRMVQVGVPLEAHAPYGQRAYAPLWETIAELDLPVAVRADGGSGVDFPPGPNGFPHLFIEYASLRSMNFIYHLTSLICEGVLDRHPNLRFVFTDGGHDVLLPLMWRMDMEWPIAKSETPWAAKLPSEYLEPHVRFTTSRLEGPSDPAVAERWRQRSDAAELLMFGSQFPHWTGAAGEPWGHDADPGTRQRVFEDNARRFYRLDRRSAAV